jgi:N-acetylglucosaminyldiphosphoundecaprenol N-acetyl-beta-D-mannosaminyltransferase
MNRIELDKKPRRLNVLGVGISAINMQLALEQIDEWIQAGEQQYVCVTGVHGVMESQRDPIVRRIHNQAGLVTPDGMPLVWLSRMNGFSHVERVYGPDFMLAVCEHSVAKGYKHFLYGGGREVARKLQKALETRFPGIKIVGIHTPPFRNLTPEEDSEIVETINQAEPDVVWVGLSTPKQERWMAGHRSRLFASALIGVGAAFDFNAGLKHQSPKWIQRMGFEWLYRLLTEPRRLWKRYLINNPLFILLIIAQATGDAK